VNSRVICAGVSDPIPNRRQGSADCIPVLVARRDRVVTLFFHSDKKRGYPKVASFSFWLAPVLV
jgi:hypothetical protein